MLPRSVFKTALIVAEDGDVELRANWAVAAMRGFVYDAKLESLSKAVRKVEQPSLIPVGMVCGSDREKRGEKHENVRTAVNDRWMKRKAHGCADEGGGGDEGDCSKIFHRGYTLSGFKEWTSSLVSTTTKRGGGTWGLQ